MMDWWLRNRGDVDDYVDRDIERSCGSKAAYESEPAARAQIAMQGLAGKLFTYECRYCRSWHLTRRKPGAPSRRAAGDEDDEADD
jgi:hypothetical protein